MDNGYLLDVCLFHAPSQMVAKLMQSWCKVDAKLMQNWCKIDNKFVFILYYQSSCYHYSIKYRVRIFISSPNLSICSPKWTQTHFTPIVTLNVRMFWHVSKSAIRDTIRNATNHNSYLKRVLKMSGDVFSKRNTRYGKIIIMSFNLRGNILSLIHFITGFTTGWPLLCWSHL